MQKTKTQTTRAASAAKLVAPSGKPAVEPAPEHHKEIRAERITLVDEAGNECMNLGTFPGGCHLSMRDSKGRARLRIRADLREATISIAGERGEAGKGVLPADDEVERVVIGYEGRAQAPRIVIKDGNERECVSLSIDEDDGDGKALFDMPNGSYTGIDSSGLGVYTEDGEPLAELSAPEDDAAPVEDHPPAALSTATPQSDTSDATIRNLVSSIVPRDNDEAAKAFISLIYAMAYNDDRCNRENIATVACDAAYERTLAFGSVAMKFFNEAEAEFPLAAA